MVDVLLCLIKCSFSQLSENGLASKEHVVVKKLLIGEGKGQKFSLHEVN